MYTPAIHDLSELTANARPVRAGNSRFWFFGRPRQLRRVQRFKAALAVLRGEAYAVRWPEPGEPVEL